MALPRVRVALGRTINMGNFESLRVDIDLEIDAQSEAKLDEAWGQAFSSVKSQLDKRVEELTGKTQEVPDPVRPSNSRFRRPVDIPVNTED